MCRDLGPGEAIDSSFMSQQDVAEAHEEDNICLRMYHLTYKLMLEQ